MIYEFVLGAKGCLDSSCHFRYNRLVPQEMLRRRNIFFDLLHECSDVWVFFLVAQFVNKINLKVSAINRMVKIKQMDFQRWLAIVAYGRPRAQAGDTVDGLKRRCFNRAAHFDCKNTRQWRAIEPDLNVGRWKAQFCAEFIAMYHATADAVGPAQKALCGW